LVARFFISRGREMRITAPSSSVKAGSSRPIAPAATAVVATSTCLRH
jgi:hypothetical protein